jgi:protein-S-isoprenylcysteine O-methyltransferase Ste14
MVKPRSLGFRLRGAAGLVAFIPMAGAVLVSRPVVRPGTWEGLAFDAAAWVLFSAGVFLRLSSIVFVGGRKGKSLVTNGPYSSCRNPLYLGSLQIALSAAMFLHSLAALAAILIAGAFYVAVVIPSEERQLSEAFPEEWKRYAAKVPRLIPRLSWEAGGGLIEVDLRALRNESLRVLGMGAIPLAAHVLWHLRAQAWWPVWWTLP